LSSRERLFFLHPLTCEALWKHFCPAPGRPFVMDLFSFLDDQPTNGTDEDGDVELVDVDAPATVQRKRRASTPPTNGHGPSITNGEPSTKKARAATPPPVVLDEFETEAKREVAASAGLAGPVEAGSRLEIRHQVRLLRR
jgi:ATP-dependent RNA helicase DOB1